MNARRAAAPAGLIACLLAASLAAGCGGGAGSRPEPRPGGSGQARSRILAVADRLSTREPHAVSVFPLPGSRYGLPGTQITFRGVAPERIGRVRVVGSVSGVHAGRIAPDSDGRGGSFLPATPFVPGETVTVRTHLDVLGTRRGSFAFSIEHPAAQIRPAPLPVVPAGRHGVQRFHSRSDLQPPSVTVKLSLSQASGDDIFLAPQNGPLQDGPMILDRRGNLVWFHPTPVSKGLLTTDFRVQHLHGRRVLTWWQGSTNAGSGRGVGVIADSRYRRIATVHAGNGLDADLHEFLITNRGQAYVIAASPVAVPGQRRPLIDSVVQEIDIKTGLVLFAWHALDHVPPRQSYKYGPGTPGHIVDPYHLNSVTIAPDGNPVISMRNTCAIYEIDHRSGQIIWRLGGKDSSFALGPGTATAFQHTVVAHHDGTLTIFDNGAGPPRYRPYSRGLRVALDETHAKATLVRQDVHSPPISANFEGGTQTLAGGDVFLGYGQRPYFTEFDARGREDFDARFTARTSSYRAYRFPWRGQPRTRPAVAAERRGGRTIVYVSWNGATRVARWRVLAGAGRARMRPVALAAKRGFETAIAIRGARYLAVEALSRSGRVLARSRTVRR